MITYLAGVLLSYDSEDFGASYLEAGSLAPKFATF